MPHAVAAGSAEPEEVIEAVAVDASPVIAELIEAEPVPEGADKISHQKPYLESAAPTSPGKRRWPWRLFKVGTWLFLLFTVALIVWRLNVPRHVYMEDAPYWDENYHPQVLKTLLNGIWLTFVGVGMIYLTRHAWNVMKWQPWTWMARLMFGEGGQKFTSYATGVLFILMFGLMTMIAYVGLFVPSEFVLNYSKDDLRKVYESNAPIAAMPTPLNRSTDDGNSVPMLSPRRRLTLDLSGEPLDDLFSPYLADQRMTLSADGREVIYVDDHGNIRWFDLETGELRRELPRPIVEGELEWHLVVVVFSSNRRFAGLLFKTERNEREFEFCGLDESGSREKVTLRAGYASAARRSRSRLGPFTQCPFGETNGGRANGPAAQTGEQCGFLRLFLLLVDASLVKATDAFPARNSEIRLPG